MEALCLAGSLGGLEGKIMVSDSCNHLFVFALLLIMFWLLSATNVTLLVISGAFLDILCKIEQNKYSRIKRNDCFFINV